MRPGVAADVHGGVEPEVESLLRVGIVLELDGVDEAVGAFEAVGFELGRESRQDFGAVGVGRETAGGGQVVEGESDDGMWIEIYGDGSVGAGGPFLACNQPMPIAGPAVKGAIGAAEDLALAGRAFDEDFTVGAGVGCLAAGDVGVGGVEDEIAVVGCGDGLIELVQSCGAVDDRAVGLNEVGIGRVFGDRSVVLFLVEIVGPVLAQLFEDLGGPIGCRWGGLIGGLAEGHRAAERNEYGGSLSRGYSRHVRSVASKMVRARYNNDRWNWSRLSPRGGRLLPSRSG